MKDKFMKNGVFSLEYDKETLKDMVLELQEESQKQKEVIDKAVKYISNKKAIINTDVIRIFDLFEIDEQGYTDELLKILNEVSK